MKCKDCKNELATCGCRCWGCSGLLIEALRSNHSRYEFLETHEIIGKHKFMTKPTTEENWHKDAYDCPKTR